MSREIKFRVWNGETMISPDYITRDGVAHWKENSVPETSANLMQYTGLKDKNGKEIYEGDIIRARGKVAKVECSVGGAWTYYFKSTKEADTWIGYRLVREELEDPIDRRGRIRDVEIIGNIHANPELLQP